jgi:hypothetical protein
MNKTTKQAQRTPGPLNVIVNGHVIGRISYNAAWPGYRFIPMYQATPSRKAWSTPEAALRGRVKNYTLESPPMEVLLAAIAKAEA